MFSSLPKGTFVHDFFINELPKRHGIWKIKRPFYVLSRLLDGNVIAGYVLYDRRSRHCFPISRVVFVKAVKAKQIKHMKYSINGVESSGDLILECLPYHQIKKVGV